MTSNSSKGSPSLMQQVGGEEGLRTLITTFYDRVFADVMIGFFFRRADKQRLIDKETELTAKFLGAPGVHYTGEPLQRAHAKHPILGGHFDRRTQILREVLAESGVSDAVQTAWLEHTQALRPQITRDQGSECDHSKTRLTGSDDE
jgi:truncated hemoglobin YjbI